MLCNFTSGLELLSALPLASAVFPPDPDDPPPSSVTTSLVEAGSWHNDRPGETRISLDLSNLVTFFDIRLAPSLALQRETQNRWEYRLRDISKSDIKTVKDAFRRSLTAPPSTSGINWKSQFYVTIDRYSDRLQALRSLLSHGRTSSAVDVQFHAHHRAKQVQSVTRIILTPFILRTTAPPSDRPSNLSWASEVFEACATAQTRALFSLTLELTDAEVLMRESIYQVHKEICRVTTRLWAQGAELGLDPVIRIKEGGATEDMGEVLLKWREEIESLMAWLDWSVWIKCQPECSAEVI
jgi:hypothetical protein